MAIGDLKVCYKFNKQSDWTLADAEKWAKENKQTPPDVNTGHILRGGWTFKTEGTKKYLVKYSDGHIRELYALNIKSLRDLLGLKRNDQVMLSPF